MNATIDIKTPAGKSLEGFPEEIINTGAETLNDIARTIYATTGYLVTNPNNPVLHKGDTITITIV